MQGSGNVAVGSGVGTIAHFVAYDTYTRSPGKILVLNKLYYYHSEHNNIFFCTIIPLDLYNTRYDI